MNLDTERVVPAGAHEEKCCASGPLQLRAFVRKIISASSSMTLRRRCGVVRALAHDVIPTGQQNVRECVRRVAIFLCATFLDSCTWNVIGLSPMRSGASGPYDVRVVDV